MTDEEAFQRELDRDRGQWQLRLVFADWLQDRGDPRAEGYRALGALRMAPVYGSKEKEYAATGRESDYTFPGYCTRGGFLLMDQGGPSVLDGCTAVMSQVWAAATVARLMEKGASAFPGARAPYDWVCATGAAPGLLRRTVEDAAARAFADLDPGARAAVLAACQQ